MDNSCKHWKDGHVTCGWACVLWMRMVSRGWMMSDNEACKAIRGEAVVRSTWWSVGEIQLVKHWWSIAQRCNMLWWHVGQAVHTLAELQLGIRVMSLWRVMGFLKSWWHHQSAKSAMAKIKQAIKKNSHNIITTTTRWMPFHCSSNLEDCAQTCSRMHCKFWISVEHVWDQKQHSSLQSGSSQILAPNWWCGVVLAQYSWK